MSSPSMKTTTEANVAADDVAPTSNVDDTAESLAASNETIDAMKNGETGADTTAVTKDPKPPAKEDLPSKIENEDDDEPTKVPSDDHPDTGQAKEQTDPTPDSDELNANKPGIDSTPNKSMSTVPAADSTEPGETEQVSMPENTTVTPEGKRKAEDDGENAESPTLKKSKVLTTPTIEPLQDSACVNSPA
mgnify:FL=1